MDIFGLDCANKYSFITKYLPRGFRVDGHPWPAFMLGIGGCMTEEGEDVNAPLNDHSVRSNLVVLSEFLVHRLGILLNEHAFPYNQKSPAHGIRNFQCVQVCK